LRRYTLGDLATSFAENQHYPRGRRLVLYDAEGDFDRNFDWWKESGKHHLLIERERGQFVPSRRRRMMANARGRSRQNPAPSCVSPAVQLTRDWSLWPEFGWIPPNLRELSKG